MMQRVPPCGPIWAAALLLALALPAWGTVARYLPFQEHLDLSDLVVRVKVGPSTAVVGEKGLPFTETTLEVLETLKGEPPAEVRVRQMRGEAKGVYMAVPGDADLLPGEEAILFLVRGKEGGFFLTALGQSKYVVERPPLFDPDGGRGGLVFRDLTDLTFYLSGQPPGMSDGIVEAPVDLDLFRKAIRESAGAGK